MFIKILKFFEGLIFGRSRNYGIKMYGPPGTGKVLTTASGLPQLGEFVKDFEIHEIMKREARIPHVIGFDYFAAAKIWLQEHPDCNKAVIFVDELEEKKDEKN